MTWSLSGICEFLGAYCPKRNTLAQRQHSSVWIGVTTPTTTVVRIEITNDSFSNRAFGSSSFHRFASVLWDRSPSSGSRFSSQSLLVRFGWTAACMCRNGRRAPRFVSRLSVAADIFGVIYRPRPVRDDPVSYLWKAVRSWRPPKVCDGTRCYPPTCGA